MPVISCPCCGNAQPLLNADLITEVLALPKMEARILAALWAGDGQPVATETMYRAMRPDADQRADEPTKQYNAFKVCLFKLRRALEGTQVRIENVGYAQGYRLVINNMQANAA
ncbi:helix-turn-helix domain-containing protein [Brucella sp. RRSP16]|uniref:helix-turn-helix domain-containing protein n=1 Tax=unclassified Brucella TaxID=2632610 RepID=UPI0015DFEB24|nr:helix-turn-helix domain-containing protein [Brucella sp. 191011898]CAB4327532.1 hypothetical protein BCH_02943 [Brucella sp. 191011898]